MYKKAVSTSEVLIIILLALAAAVIIIMISSGSSKKLDFAAEIVTSCRDTSGTCDCYFDGASCPAGTTMAISLTCPKPKATDKCTDKSIDTDAKASREAFSSALKDVEKQAKVSLNQDELLIMKYRYFGRCCIGAQKPI